jgi:DNA-binding CsgD family transcriptional regulator
LTAKVIDLFSLIDKIYAAALSPTHDNGWRDLLLDLEHSVQGARALIALQDAHTAKVALFEAPNMDAAAQTAYAQYYSIVNPWTRHLDQLSAGNLHTTDMLMPDRELRKTEFYSGWLRPNGISSGSGCAILKDASRLMIFSFLNSPHAEAFVEDELQLMRHLLPHFQRAAQLRRQFAQIELKSNWATESLNRLSVAVLLLDVACRVVFLNNRAAEMLKTTRTLYLDAVGCLRAARVNDDSALARLINNAQGLQLRRGTGAGGMLKIDATETHPGLSILIAPFNLCTGLSTRFGPYVTAFVTVGQQAPAPDPELLASLYGLTATEGRILSKLATGLSTKAIATAHGVSLNTVRNQVQHLLEKTGTHRQSSLLARVLADLSLT